MNNMGFSSNSARNQAIDEINEKYKTQRCRHYESHKICALGDKCHFAHEDQELRKPGDPINPEILHLAMKSQQYQNCNQQINQRFNKNKQRQGYKSFNNNGGNFNKPFNNNNNFYNNR